MTRLWQHGEPISVEVNRHLEPMRLTWRQRDYTIQRIEQQWEVDHALWEPQGQIQRRYFAITTTSGLLCVLFYDQVRDLWFLSKVYD